MAFVRWRGNSATLLASVYEGGRSRQVRLANLGAGYGVSDSVRRSVIMNFPDIQVDWNAVNTAMAQGPTHSAPLTEKQMDYLTVENLLCEWASYSSPYPQECTELLRAAAVLQHWRVRQETERPTS